MENLSPHSSKKYQESKRPFSTGSFSTPNSFLSKLKIKNENLKEENFINFEILPEEERILYDNGNQTMQQDESNKENASSLENTSSTIADFDLEERKELLILKHQKILDEKNELAILIEKENFNKKLKKSF